MTDAHPTSTDDARALLRTSGHGVLCTLSKKESGWPFGSITPYALSARGEPILFIARIAEHFRNIEADNRVSLFVHAAADPAGGDVQEHARVTLLGRATPVPESRREDAWARYRARLPQAEDYERTHGFELVQIEPTKVRFIGGFGKIFWLDAESVMVNPESDPLRGVADMVIGHMNQDHEDALLTYCRAFAKISPRAAKLVGVDRYGMDLEVVEPDRRVRIEFLGPVGPDTIRKATIDLLAAARAALV